MTNAPQSTIEASFARAMAGFAPFEPKPELAVAVSGGADSVALALLADRWARARGGRVTALTVDHGLRPEAAREARQVGRWLKAAGIRHVILRWSPPAMKKTAKARLANLQAAARDARYDLLCGWCHQHAVLHLLLAHHRDDQAETLLLRLARGSGLDGLAAMAPLVERSAVRLLRPLLAVPKTAITGYLQSCGQPWIEDPSNQDIANARVRIRQLLPRLADEGMTASRLTDTAERLAQARAALDGAVNRLLAQAVAIYPEGYLRLDTAELRAADRDIGLRAVARAIACIGGEPYGPRLERLARLYDMLSKMSKSDSETALGRGRTLGGCRIVPARRADGDPSRHVLVVREPAAVAPPAAWAGRAMIWDHRFLISGMRRNSAVTVGALTDDGLRDLAHKTGRDDGIRRGLPHDVLVTLPAIRRGAVLLAVPHLGYTRVRANMTSDRTTGWQARFAPISALTRPGFTLV